MASPQKENGFTPIANEILDQIAKLNLNGTQFRIIMAVWRYTYGFSRKEHALSETFLSKAINVARPNISREIRPLYEKKILTIVRAATFGSAAVISFNKNYDEWQQVSNSITGIENATGIENNKITGIESDTTTGIESDTQERNNKNKIKKDVQEFFETVWKLYPEKKGKGKVAEKSKKALYELGHEIIKKCIERYIESKPEWQHFQNGSTFFNSGYVDYLDKNYIEDVSEQAEKYDPLGDSPEEWSGF